MSWPLETIREVSVVEMTESRNSDETDLQIWELEVKEFIAAVPYLYFCSYPWMLLVTKESSILFSLQ